MGSARARYLFALGVIPDETGHVECKKDKIFGVPVGSIAHDPWSK
jgi:hypothetical protein